MRKSILIGVLAALMLFAFTACDNQVSTYKIPNGMTAETSKTVYLEGERIDPSTITATVYYTDGSSEKISGDRLGVPAEAVTLEAEKTSATKQIEVSFGGKTAEVTVNVYKVDKAVLSNLPTTAQVDPEKGIVVNTDSVGVTVYYNNSLSSRTLVKGEYKLEAKVAENAEPGSKDQSVTSTLEAFDQSVTSIEGDENWKVDVDEYTLEFPAYDEEKFAGVYLVMKYNDKYEMPEKFYIGDTIDWEVYCFSGDEDDSLPGMKKATEGVDYFFKDGLKPASKHIELGKDNLDKAVEYTINVVSSVDGPLSEKSITLTIPKATDYIETIKSVTANSDSTFTAGEDAQLNMFKVTYELASGGEPVTVSADDTELFTAVLIDEEIQTGSYSPRFEIAYGVDNAKLWKGSVAEAIKTAE